MKKISFVILLVIFVLSLGLNLKVIQEKNRNKEIMINNLYTTIIEVIRELESFVATVDENDINKAKSKLVHAAIGLIEVDNQIKYGTMYVDNQLYHPGILSFRFIGEGLIYGTNVNGMTIKSIFEDDVVSDSENEYINRLNTDLKNIVKELTLKEPYIPNEKLSIKNLNDIFGSFYNTWSHIDEAPYELVWE
ncbi:MAG: hypothetical protein APF77_22110 [Clostridia bacterium BRH_c25]|nr:MAG: hypothetical protein APF77_22110 [Clostridia bacterium BRH_c25]